MMLRKWKKNLHLYLNRHEFDYLNKEIDPMAYHAPFIKLATVYGAIPSENKMLRYIMPVATITGATTAAAILVVSLYQYIQIWNIKSITESMAYLLMMCYQILIMLCIIAGKKNYPKLLNTLKHDFHYISTQKIKYRENFFKNQLLTFKASVGVIFITIFTGAGMALCICVTFAVSLFTNGSNFNRPLPFPFYLGDYDLTVSPRYQIVLIMSFIFTCLFSPLYSFMLQSYVIWIRVITTKADIITWNLQDLLVDIPPAKSFEERKYNDALVKHRMKHIIEMHQSMFEMLEDYAKIFKKTLLYEQMIASPIICMTAYCFAEELDQGKAEFLLLFLCVGSIEVTFIPNYLCTHLLEKVQSIADASWDIPFWNAGPVTRPYLVLIMQRSLRSLPLVAHGFANVSLETYANMLTRAYSCFNMLRQTDIKR